MEEEKSWSKFQMVLKIRQKVINRALKVLGVCRPEIYYLSLLQFVDCLCQHSQTAKQLIKLEGVEILTSIISKYYYTPLTGSLCMKTIKCLYNLLRIIDEEERLSIVNLIEPLTKLQLGKDQQKKSGTLTDGFEEFEGERTKSFSLSLDKVGVRKILNEMLEKTLSLMDLKLIYEN
jgi:hypothetical protein